MNPAEASAGPGSKAARTELSPLLYAFKALSVNILALARGGDKENPTPKDRIDNSIPANLLSPPKASFLHHTHSL